MEDNEQFKGYAIEVEKPQSHHIQHVGVSEQPTDTPVILMLNSMPATDIRIGDRVYITGTGGDTGLYAGFVEATGRKELRETVWERLGKYDDILDKRSKGE